MSPIPPLVGPHMAELREMLQTLAREPAPLLIIGEEGVGKSLLARHIQAVSEKSESPPTVNLATASPRTGLLSLLGSDFEYLTTTKRSVLEHDGVVIIKHVGAAAREVQDQIADALRNGHFTRPGAVRKAKVACRPIFTLRVKGGERYNPLLLSQKLFEYLASVRKITIPPLRERPGDIVAIARQSLGRDLSPELELVLLAHDWPGNVTELKASLLLLRPFAGAVEHPADECLVDVASLLLGIQEGREVSMREGINQLQQKLAAHAMRRTDGRLSHAARLLGLTPNALRWHLRKTPPAF